MGMHADPAAMSTKIPGYPAVRTKCAVSLTRLSVIVASTSIAGTLAAHARVTVRFRHARLDRPDEQPARDGDAPGDRGAARGRARGAGDGARFRADDRTLRTVRDRAHAGGAPPRRARGGEGSGS